MWQPSSQRRGHGKKSGRMKLPLHVNRVNARIEFVAAQESPELCPLPLDVRVILNDLNQRGVGIFCSVSLTIGQVINLFIPNPLQITLKAKVIWCQEYSMDTHVLSTHSFAHRAGLEFIATTPEEKAAIEKLCADVMKQYVLTHKDSA